MKNINRIKDNSYKLMEKHNMNQNLKLKNKINVIIKLKNYLKFFFKIINNFQNKY